MSLAVKSFAKVNLSLDVLNRRPDGFHNISAVFYEIDLSDSLYFELTNIQGVTLDVTGDAPTGDDNLIVTAAKWVITQAGCWNGLKIKLEKNIPMQAGLGGGSSNAAATLKAASKILNYDQDLKTIAACLGSDVMFFLNGGAALGTGRGQVIRRIPTELVLHMLIVKPQAGVPTGWAYGELDKIERQISPDRSERMAAALAEGSRQGIIENLGNDFELVAYKQVPEIASLKKRLIEAGAEAALLCGSGSSVFGIFPTRQAAEDARASFPDVWSAAASGLPGGHERIW